MRASRVRRPAFFRTGRRSGSNLISARAIPCEMAPAWPLVPPPNTFTLTSNLRCRLVMRSGARAAISRTLRPRYASVSLSLITTRPSPGWMRTRATAFLRRPVPRWKMSANLELSLGIEGERLRLLCLVPMLGTGVNAKTGEHIRAQRVVLQHPFHRIHEREGGDDLLGLLQGAPAEADGVAAVVRVFLGAELRAGDLDLGGVDHHDVIAAVQVRRVRRLVLAAQY